MSKRGVGARRGPEYYDVSQLGSKGRKAGIEPPKNARRDLNGMEEIDEYFSGDSAEDEESASTAISQYPTKITDYRPPKSRLSSRPSALPPIQTSRFSNGGNSITPKAGHSFISSGTNGSINRSRTNESIRSMDFDSYAVNSTHLRRTSNPTYRTPPSTNQHHPRRESSQTSSRSIETTARKINFLSGSKSYANSSSPRSARPSPQSNTLKHSINQRASLLPQGTAETSSDDNDVENHDQMSYRQQSSRYSSNISISRSPEQYYEPEQPPEQDYDDNNDDFEPADDYDHADVDNFAHDDSHHNNDNFEDETTRGPDPPSTGKRRAPGFHTDLNGNKDSIEKARNATAKNNGVTRLRKKQVKKPAVIRERSVDENGLRRSTRIKIKPLAYWRNERIVYNLDHDDEDNLVKPQIKEIIYTKSPQVMPRVRHESATVGHKPAKKRKIRKDSDVETEKDIDNLVSEFNEDEDWLVHGEINMEINDFPDTEEKIERVICHGADVEFQDVLNATFSMAALYEETRNFMAGGIMSIKVGGQKPVKPSRHNHYMFYVINGLVEVDVSGNLFRLRKGGSFEVPRGNFYSITNLYDRESRLFFVQGTDTLFNEELNDE